MINILDWGFEEFKRKISFKKVFVYGAGRALENCLQTYLDNKDIEAVIDNNENLCGHFIEHREKQVEIVNMTEFLQKIDKLSYREDVVIIINSTVYAAEIVEMMDNLPQLEGINCCIQALIINKKEEIANYEFSKGMQKIPKIIHYIWVGGNPLPEEYVRNIETWKKYNPEYEIIRWDETNYDFRKCKYIKEAYENCAWGFVPNYARLDIVYEYGGIYLDTDVEAVRSFDCLLNDAAFFNMGRLDRVNQGCGFGAEKGNPIVGEMRNSFENATLFDKNGKPKSCHSFIHPILRNYGFEIKNQYQKIEKVALYPCEVMSPLTIDGMDNYFSDKTVSIHKEAGSWRSEKEQAGVNNLKKIISHRT